MANVSESTERISVFEKFCFGCGDVGCVVIWNVIGMFLTIYYTDDLKLSAAAVSAILLSVRIFDGFSDLVMGYFLDRTNSKLGKARPWILWSSPFMAIFLVLCFSVPDFGNEVLKIAFAFLTYFFLTVVIYTVCNLSYCSLTSFMTSSVQERASMNAYRFMMTGVCSLALAYITPAAAKSLGWFGICVVYGLVALALLLLCFFFCKERVQPQVREPGEKVSARESLSVLSRNTFFYYLVSFFMIEFVMIGVSGGSGMYFARYIVGDDNFFGSLNLASTLPQIISGFCFPWIMKLVGGKWNAMIWGYVLYLIGYGLCFAFVGTELDYGTADFYIMVVGLMIKGVGFGMHLVALFAMIADVAEYGEWKTGRRLEGATYSVSSFGFKIGLGAGGAIIGLVLASVDYNPDLPQQPIETLEAILDINFLIPLILSAIGLVIALTNNLDKIYPQVMKDLAVRRANEARKLNIDDMASLKE